MRECKVNCKDLFGDSIINGYVVEYTKQSKSVWSNNYKEEIRIRLNKDKREDTENMKFKYMPISAEEIMQLYTDYKSGEIYKDLINQIKDVVHHDPATIVKWKDGTKTVVKVQAGDTYNKEFGLAMCIIKKMCGNKGNYNEVFKKWCK